MLRPLQKPCLVAHSTALEAAGLALVLASRVPAPLRSLGDQVIRAGSSPLPGLAKTLGGQPDRSGRDRVPLNAAAAHCP